MRKMKKAEEDYKSILVRYKEARCENESLKEELNNAYSKIKFLELEVVQANAKVARVASKKLDEVLSYQKPTLDKSGLGFTEEGSSSGQAIKEVKFVKAKNVAPTSAKEEKVTKNPKVVNQKAIVKNPKPNVTRPKAKGRTLPKNKRGP